MRKPICAFLAFMIFSFSVFIEVQAVEENQTAGDLQSQQEEIKNQINEESEKLEGVKEELSQNLQQVQKLDEKIAKSQTEIDELKVKIEELQKSIEKVEKKLKKATQRYERQKEILEKRLIAMYESGDTNYLDVILSSKSISDFLSNYFLTTELANYDTELLEDMEHQKYEIEIDKKKLDSKKEEFNTIRENQTKTMKILENTKIIRQSYIDKLSTQEQEIQAKIDEYNTQFEEINKEILSLALQGIDTKYIGGELAWPIPGYTRVTSKYGMRTHPITGVYKLHTGVDISAPQGANFVAANDGIVVKASYNGAYGNMVIVDHGGGVSTLYAHGSEIMVNVGDLVKRGETVLLKVGSTGYSTGPHAHFEVRLNGVVTDPMPYITNGLVPTTQSKEDTNNQENTTSQQNTENNEENNVN